MREEENGVPRVECVDDSRQASETLHHREHEEWFEACEKVPRPHPRSRRVPDVDSNCRLLIVPPFRGSSRFESLILSHHSRTKLHVSVINEVKAEASVHQAFCGLVLSEVSL